MIVVDANENEYVMEVPSEESQKMASPAKLTKELMIVEGDKF